MLKDKNYLPKFKLRLIDWLDLYVFVLESQDIGAIIASLCKIHILSNKESVLVYILFCEIKYVHSSLLDKGVEIGCSHPSIGWCEMNTSKLHQLIDN